MFDKRITIFAGHFGSGKTEVAVNYAIQLKTMKDRVALLDFDIVNPYFRAADAAGDLEAKGISVYLPEYANLNVESANFPPEVNSVFVDKDIYAVFDVGGDDLGAKAISRFKKEFLKNEFDFYLVINSRRPMTDTSQKIVDMCLEIKESAGLAVTGLINNTNILSFTTKETLLEGHDLIAQASAELNIPVAFVSGFLPVIDEIDIDGIPKLILNKYIRLPWEGELNNGISYI